MPALGQKTLSENLQLVAKAIPAKSVIDMLTGVLFQGDGEIITLSSTNLEWSIQAKFEMPHFEEFGVVLPAKVVDIVSKMPGETIDFLISEELQTTLVSGKSKFILNGIKDDEFPRLSVPDDPLLSFSVNNGALKAAFGKTLFASSGDESRPVFTGACFTLLSEDTLRICTTDTYRLAVTHIPVKAEITSEEPFVVPAKFLAEIAKILPSGESSLVKVTNKAIYFQSKNLTTSAPLLHEKFPLVDRVIPNEFTGTATVVNKTLLDTISRVRLVNDDTKATVNINVQQDALSVTTRSGKGNAEESISLTLEGEGCEFVLNSKFLVEGFKVISGENCSLHFSGSNRPVVIKDSADADYLYLILPIKI